MSRSVSDLSCHWEWVYGDRLGVIVIRLISLDLQFASRATNPGLRHSLPTILSKERYLLLFLSPSFFFPTTGLRKSPDVRKSSRARYNVEHRAEACWKIFSNKRCEGTVSWIKFPRFPDAGAAKTVYADCIVRRDCSVREWRPATFRKNRKHNECRTSRKTRSVRPNRTS